MIAGTIIIKIDTGPGRLGASLENIEKRQEAWNNGIILLFGLPNTTAVQQELDWLFRLFKCRLTNDDFAIIGNGRPDEDLSKKLFDATFTKASISKAFFEIGFAPHTMKCLKNEKVRHELGEENDQYNMSMLQEKYESLKDEAKEIGFNVKVFDHRSQPKQSYFAEQR